MSQFITRFLKPATRFVAKLLAIYAIVGAYDVSRNKGLNREVARRYFLGNGVLTWILSPINTLFDVLCLPYVNKGVYQLDDLPSEYQVEIQRMIASARESNLVEQLEGLVASRARTMMFFKWYGENIETSVNIPAFHEEYKYIQTIGVSVFNKRQSTTKHFGPFRVTLRVLYNINRMDDASAYIEVGDVKHYWRDEPLFIFDDTLMHQSFNETDQTRYCMFVDILRPSFVPGVLARIVQGARFLMRGCNYMFYKNWDVIKN